MRHANLPFHLYVNVANSALGPTMQHGVTRGILHAVHCRPGQPVMGHVLLESGAHWSGMLWHLISTSEEFPLEQRVLQPWGAMGEELQAWHINYLEGLPVKTRTAGAGRHTGIMLDWADGFSRYPAEHKPLNMIELEGGQFALLPNNYCVFSDRHFIRTDKGKDLHRYRRNDVTLWSE